MVCPEVPSESEAISEQWNTIVGHLLLTPKKVYICQHTNVIQIIQYFLSKKVDDSGIWKSRYQGRRKRLQIPCKVTDYAQNTTYYFPHQIFGRCTASIDFKSLVYSGTVDNLYLLDRLLVMYFSTPFLLQNLYWIFRRLPASFIQTVTRSIYFYKKKESRQLSRNIK